MRINVYNLLGYFLKLSERLLFLARPEGKSSGSGHNWPLRTDLSRITQPEAIRSAQTVRSSCKIRVLTFIICKIYTQLGYSFQLKDCEDKVNKEQSRISKRRCPSQSSGCLSGWKQRNLLSKASLCRLRCVAELLGYARPKAKKFAF